MPIHLPPLSRRRFLQGTVAAAAGLAWRSELAAAPRAVDPHRFALLADIHIAADAAQVTNRVPLAEHLRLTVEQVLGLDRLPARVFVDGDCAYGSGLPGDYQTLIQLFEPLRAASVPIDLALGNHDDRKNFRAALLGSEQSSPLADRHVAVIETPRAHWFLLDSLTYDTGRPGGLGAEQLAWLARELDARTDRPAIVLAHHNPVFLPPNATTKPSGLRDATALFEILVPRKQVKAFVFGHTHAMKLSEHEGIHLINLPAVAYPAIQSAWCDLQLHADGATLERYAVGTESLRREHRYELKWRQT